jgi:hypothetical protein
VSRESSLLPHRCESVPRNLREQLRGVQPVVLGLDDRPDCRREPRVFDDLPGLIWWVVTGSADDAGDSAQFAGINIGKGAGIGTIDEEVRGIRGGIVDQVQVGHRQIGQDSANVDPLLLEAFKPVADVTDRCGVPHAVGEFWSTGPHVGEKRCSNRDPGLPVLFLSPPFGQLGPVPV